MGEFLETAVHYSQNDSRSPTYSESLNENFKQDFRIFLELRFLSFVYIPNLVLLVGLQNEPRSL